MASQRPSNEPYARARQSIRSIQPVQQTPPQRQYMENRRPDHYPEYAQVEPQQSPERSPLRQRQRPQSQYLNQEQAPTQDTNTRTELKHSRSHSHALFPFKRKEVPNAAPKRAQSFLQHQQARVSPPSRESDLSEPSNLSSTNVSAHTSETSPSMYPPQHQEQQQRRKPQGYSHHAAVKGAVGYVPEEPIDKSEGFAFSKKIVVVGDGGSGKTSLLMRYKSREFPEHYVPTVFENYITEKRHRGTGKVVEIALWDTAGQEEYDRLRPLSYPETDILLFCFAIDCPQSLDSIKEKWYPEVAHFCPDTPTLLVACKSDLRDNESCIDLLEGQGLRPTTVDEGRAMAKFIGAEAYIECSSKNHINVDETFEAAIDVCIAQQQGTDWSRGSVGQQLQTGRMGEASQAYGKPVVNTGRGNGNGRSTDYTKEGVKKKKKSRACKIL